MAAWADGHWQTRDGLTLHYRDYAGGAGRPPILCLHGLTRNARDWEPVAARLAGERRLIVPSLRGRGESGYAKDPMSYAPATYAEDLAALLEVLALTRIVAFGTSLGGLLTMLLAAARPWLVAGALLNDIGPEIAAAGLGRIRGYVGRGGSFPTWLHAARAVAEVNGAAHPGYAIEDWLAMAKRLCRLTPAGRIVYDYDMKIAEPFRLPGGDAPVDLWPAFDALAEAPLLIVRGALSDLLTAETAAAMAARAPAAELVTVPDVGHAPTLDEPAARDAVDRLLARTDAAS